MVDTQSLLSLAPYDWSDEDYVNNDYALVNIPEYTAIYDLLASKVSGKFNRGIKKIQRVQNPFVYGQFLLKKEEYKSRNINFQVMELFHDTGESKIRAIVRENLDWRLSQRIKYGRGVSFSPSPGYANCKSSHSNGTNRAMIIADVLVGVIEDGNEHQELPLYGSDTTVGNCKNVYVKYHDNEYYPKYVIYYDSVPPMSHRYRNIRYF